MPGKGSSKGPAPRSHTPRVTNRRARFDYVVLEKVECGIELLGTEVKSLRAGQASLEGAFARLQGNEVFLCGCNIAIYPQAVGALQHDPLRQRKLLLHRAQIRQLRAHAEQKGHTLIPLALYFGKGWAKCELAAAVGRRTYDKRQAIRTRQQERDIARQMRHRGRQR
jgi:SsrA-binding protein